MLSPRNATIARSARSATARRKAASTGSPRRSGSPASPMRKSVVSIASGAAAAPGDIGARDATHPAATTARARAPPRHDLTSMTVHRQRAPAPRALIADEQRAVPRDRNAFRLPVSATREHCTRDDAAGGGDLGHRPFAGGDEQP